MLNFDLSQRPGRLSRAKELFIAFLNWEMIDWPNFSWFMSSILINVLHWPGPKVSDLFCQGLRLRLRFEGLRYLGDIWFTYWDSLQFPEPFISVTSSLYAPGPGVLFFITRSIYDGNFAAILPPFVEYIWLVFIRYAFGLGFEFFFSASLKKDPNFTLFRPRLNEIVLYRLIFPKWLIDQQAPGGGDFSFSTKLTLFPQPKLQLLRPVILLGNQYMMSLTDLRSTWNLEALENENVCFVVEIFNWWLTQDYGL